MGRKRKELRVWARGNGYYQFSLGIWPAGKRVSTGTTDQREAYRIAERALAEEKARFGQGRVLVSNVLRHAYDWDECLHVKRLREEGKTITPQHAENMRRLIERFIHPDSIMDAGVDDLRIYHVLELRERIRQQTTANQTNRTIKAMRAVFEEWKRQQRILRNPIDGVGTLATKEEPVGVFSGEELAALFKEAPGVWSNLTVYAAFLLAAATGMRRGEISVDRAIKGNGSIGLPKWEKIRTTFLPTGVSSALKTVRENSLRVLPDQLVFGNKAGEKYSGGWWEHHFRMAMSRAGFMDRIKEKGKPATFANPRNLRPHSLRHSVATLLRAGGIDAAAIRASMGWSNEHTQDGYTHWAVEHFENQRRAIDELFG